MFHGYYRLQCLRYGIQVCSMRALALAWGVPEDFLSWLCDQSVRQLITGCLTQVLCHHQERSPMDVCKVSCVVSPSSVGMSTQLPLESRASSQGLSKLREGRMSCPRGGDTTIQREGKGNWLEIARVKKVWQKTQLGAIRMSQVSISTGLLLSPTVYGVSLSRLSRYANIY